VLTQGTATPRFVPVGNVSADDMDAARTNVSQAQRYLAGIGLEHAYAPGLTVYVHDSAPNNSRVPRASRGSAEFDPRDGSVHFRHVGLGPGGGMNTAHSQALVTHEMVHRTMDETIAGAKQVPLPSLENATVQEHVANVLAFTESGDPQPEDALFEPRMLPFMRPSYSMRDPARTGSPDMANRFRRSIRSDAHLNQAILDRAAVDMYDDRAIGPDRLARIYAHAITNNLHANDNITTAARAIWRSAQQLHGEDSPQARGVLQAFARRGLTEDMLLRGADLPHHLRMRSKVGIGVAVAGAALVMFGVRPF
jgi:hypothetical protein